MTLTFDSSWTHGVVPPPDLERILGTWSGWPELRAHELKRLGGIHFDFVWEHVNFGENFISKINMKTVSMIAASFGNKPVVFFSLRWSTPPFGPLWCPRVVFRSLSKLMTPAKDAVLLARKLQDKVQSGPVGPAWNVELVWWKRIPWKDGTTFAYCMSF